MWFRRLLRFEEEMIFANLKKLSISEVWSLEIKIQVGMIISFLFLAVPGFEFRAFTLSHSTSLFL
jgi:hypothetical protein